jgi:hypothetical protein
MNPQPAQPVQSSMMPNIGNVASGIGDTASNAFGNITSSLTDARANLNSAVSDFSSKSAVDASSEFLESNTIVAKFAFIFIVLVGFMLLFRLGSIIMGYFFMPSNSPYLVQGKINGSEALVIKQDSRSSYPVLKYSENEETGIEFTYSTWIYLNGNEGPYKHVFSKGNLGTNLPSFDNNNILISSGNNAPALYVKTNADNTNSGLIIMDTMEDEGSLQTNVPSKIKYIEVNNLPFRKWINIIIRLQNRVLDVYVNGVLTGRKDLQYIPRQNYGPVNICQNGGFTGNLSNLRYFDSALNVFQINQIVSSGPDTSTSKNSPSGDSTGFYYYLSSQFYQSNNGI